MIRVVPVGLLFLTPAPFLSPADETNTMTPEDFVSQYESALAAQSWDKVAPLIHENCTVTFSNGSSHRGKEQVREAFQRNFDLIEDEKYSLSDLHWIVKDDNIAVFTYSYHWSGTISGEEPGTYGSFLELSWRGSRPLTLPEGETRTFLKDGDRVVLSGEAVRGDLRIGFGEVEGTVSPAVPPTDRSPIDA